jgi:hypothetical protein
MPNWCQNSVTFTHADPKEIQRMKDAFLADNLLHEFVPLPAELKDTVSGSYGDPVEQAKLQAQIDANLEKHGYATWYEFCINEWGTKWDVSGYDDGIVALTENSITLLFDTAWSPPIAWYERLLEQGWGVSGYYNEEGMAYCGRYEDGIDDYYEYSDLSAEEVADQLPSDIDECFSISERKAEWEAEQEYEDE